MKRFFGFAVMLSLIAAPAFGSPKASTIVIPEKVMAGTTAVPAGTYKMTFTGTGPSVQVTLTKDKKTIATFAAKQVNGKNNAGVETYSHNGVVSLETINLDNFSLVLEGAPQPGQ